MTQGEQMRLTVEGLVRNFGKDAAGEAERIARRYARSREKSGHIFWTAMAGYLRESQGRARPVADKAAAESPQQPTL